MWKKNTRGAMTNIGSILVVLAIILIVRNVISTVRTVAEPSWPYSFFDTLMFASYDGLPQWSYLLNFVPIPLLIIGVPLVIIGARKDRAKASALAAQAQMYGQPGQQGYAQAAYPPAPQGGQAASPAAQAPEQAAPAQNQGQPPYGQVPPLS